jgi:hypothetical protein
VREELAIALVDFGARDLESDHLVWLGGKEEVLVLSVCSLLALLERRHEAVPRLLAFLDLWVVDLHKPYAS